MKRGFFVLALLFLSSCVAPFYSPSHSPARIKEDSILTLKLEGVIFDRLDFLEDLNEYIKEDRIKGVLIRINSPGGDVADSQEIYRDIHRLKTKYKKPIVISVGSMAASGGFYVSMAGDMIVASEGSIIGSIGVLMIHSNMEKLLEWAKVEYTVIKTGEFKGGTPFFRSMTSRERDLIQDLLDKSLDQFKSAVVKDRKLSAELVDEYADGRVFLGETGVLQGFIDRIGTYGEALDIVGELSGLGKDPSVFEPPKKWDHWTEALLSSSVFKNFFPIRRRILPVFFQSQNQGRLFYLMPEAFGF